MIRDAKTEEGLTEENFKVRGIFSECCVKVKKIII